MYSSFYMVRNMKKYGKIAVIFMSLLLLSGCRMRFAQKTADTEEHAVALDDMPYAETEEYENGQAIQQNPSAKGYIEFEDDDCIIPDEEISVYTAEDTQLVCPSGICVFGNELVIADRSENRLYRYDLDCNYLGTVGAEGRGELEFKLPMALEVYADRLYVLDAGNYRIQILDESYSYISEIQLNPQNYANGGGIYWDLAVKDEDCIYVSTSGANGIESRIAKISRDGQQNFADVFLGHLCSYRGEVYAVNTMEYVQVDERTELFQSGTHGLYRITDDSLELLWYLPQYCIIHRLTL